MRWDSWTGVEPETPADYRQLRRTYWRFAASLGRVCVVYAIAYVFLVSTPAATIQEVSRAVTIAGTTIWVTPLGPVLIGAVVWAFAPMVTAAYRLYRIPDPEADT